MKPLHENDFDDMYKLISDPVVTAAMESAAYNDPATFKKDFTETVKGNECLSIRDKETDCFTGYILIHQYVKQGKISYSQMVTAFLPEYWGCGYCTEATEKSLHFAFLGIKTPWLCANQFQDNPAAGSVLKKCGLHFYKTWKMGNRPYNQYRYKINQYLTDNNMPLESDGLYDFSLDIRASLSPYSYEKPIRVIDHINFIEQPTSYLCGQSVIAMLAGVSVDEVIDVMQTDKGTSIPDIRDALKYYGLKTVTNARVKHLEGKRLPACCVLSVKLPGYGHWSLYYKGKFYDPEFGVLDELPINARLVSYWEILI